MAEEKRTAAGAAQEEKTAGAVATATGTAATATGTAQAGEPAGAGSAEAEPAKEGRTYDQAYVDELLEKQAQAREAAVAEALKVAGMDAESKAQYEKEQADKKLADREAEIARRELRADARELLAEKGISQDFLDLLVGKDMKDTKARIEAFKARYDADVQAQVEKRMVGKTPQAGNGGTVSEGAAMRAEMEKYIYN